MNIKFLKALARKGLVGISLAALSVGAMASSNDDRQLQTPDATANSASVLGNMLTNAQTQVSTWTATANIAMNVWYTGPSTAAFINIASGGSASSNCITFFAPFNVIDPTVGAPGCSQTGGAIDLGVSTATSMGQVCDLINAAQAGNVASNYHCKLIGAIRNDPATLALSTFTESAGVNPLNQAGGFSIQFATNTVLTLGITPAVGRRVVLEQCQVNSANTNLQVFGRKRGYGQGKDQQGNVVTDSSIVWSASPLTANTLGYIPSQYVVYPWIEFQQNNGNTGTTVPTAIPTGGAYVPFQTPQGTAYDGHVVVRSGNFSSLASSNYGPGTSSNYLTCTWLEK